MNSVSKKAVIVISTPLRGVGRLIQDHFVLPPTILLEKGYIVDVLFTTSSIDREMIAARFPKGINVVHIHAIPRLLKYYKQNKHALFFINSRVARSFLACRYGSKTIFMSHNSSLPKKSWQRLILKFFLRFVDKIRVVNAYERDELLKLNVPPKKINIIPLAIDYQYYGKPVSQTKLNAFKKKYAIEKKDTIILFLAQLRKFKNPTTMLKAFSLLKDKYPHLKLLFVGGDRLEEEGVPSLTKQIRTMKLPEDRIIQTGSLSHEEVLTSLGVVDIGVNTSFHEGMCMVVYEMASANVPLCLSAIGSFTSMFQEGALFHPPTDHALLARNISRYLDDSLFRKHMAARNYVLVSTKTSYATVKEQLTRLLLA